MGEKGASMCCWSGEAEGLFPAICSLGNPTRNCCRKAERKSSSVLGAAVTSDNATLPTAKFECTVIWERAIAPEIFLLQRATPTEPASSRDNAIPQSHAQMMMERVGHAVREIVPQYCA